LDGHSLAYTGLLLVFLTAFLDLLEIAFGQILWFVRTLRFWLYFGLHVLVSILAAVLLFWGGVKEWYWVGLLGPLLGVGVISNSNVKFAGTSLLPVAELFTKIKKDMYDQAAQEKADELTRANLIGRLQKLPVGMVEAHYETICLAAGHDGNRIADAIDAARRKAGQKENRTRTILISRMMRVNWKSVETHLATWEAEVAAAPP